MLVFIVYRDRKQRLYYVIELLNFCSMSAEPKFEFHTVNIIIDIDVLIESDI